MAHRDKCPSPNLWPPFLSSPTPPCPHLSAWPHCHPCCFWSAQACSCLRAFPLVTIWAWITLTEYPCGLSLLLQVFTQGHLLSKVYSNCLIESLISSPSTPDPTYQVLLIFYITFTNKLNIFLFIIFCLSSIYICKNVSLWTWRESRYLCQFYSLIYPEHLATEPGAWWVLNNTFWMNVWMHEY